MRRSSAVSGRWGTCTRKLPRFCRVSHRPCACTACRAHSILPALQAIAARTALSQTFVDRGVFDDLVCLLQNVRQPARRCLFAALGHCLKPSNLIFLSLSLPPSPSPRHVAARVACAHHGRLRGAAGASQGHAAPRDHQSRHFAAVANQQQARERRSSNAPVVHCLRSRGNGHAAGPWCCSGAVDDGPQAGKGHGGLPRRPGSPRLAHPLAQGAHATAVGVFEVQSRPFSFFPSRLTRSRVLFSLVHAQAAAIFLNLKGVQELVRAARMAFAMEPGVAREDLLEVALHAMVNLMVASENAVGIVAPEGVGLFLDYVSDASAALCNPRLVAVCIAGLRCLSAHPRPLRALQSPGTRAHAAQCACPLCAIGMAVHNAWWLCAPPCRFSACHFYLCRRRARVPVAVRLTSPASSVSPQHSRGAAASCAGAAELRLAHGHRPACRPASRG